MTSLVAYVILQGMKEIPLTQGKVTLVDDADYEYLNQFKWCAWHNQNGIWYAVRTPMRVYHAMHRVILGITDSKTYTDHIDGDGLNNQRSNLRLATPAQNVRNTRIQKNNKSGHKGVSWDKTSNKWRTAIQVDGKGKTLGRFSKIEDAIAAYEEAATKLFGEFKRKI